MNESTSNIPQFVTFWERLCYLLQSDEIQRIADRLDLVYNTVANYRRGRQPETSTLIKIYEKTGASIHWLLFNDGPMLRTETQRVLNSASSQQEPHFPTTMRVVIEISSPVPVSVQTSHLRDNDDEKVFTDPH